MTTTEIVKAGGETAAERKANAIGAALDLRTEPGIRHAQAGFRPGHGWSVKIVSAA